MANDLLLRLFNSEFFNPWIAVSYLFKYCDNQDIQQYLCHALKRFPLVEIEFFLPQLIHLLISQPTSTSTLEDTLIDMCKQSPHFAVMSIWSLQAYMADWMDQPDSASHQVCIRVLQKCQQGLLVDSSIDDDFETLLPTYRQPSQHSDSSEDHVATPPAQSRPFSFTVSLEDLHGGKAFSLSNYLFSWAPTKQIQHIRRMVRNTIEPDAEQDIHVTTMGTSSVPHNHGQPPSPTLFDASRPHSIDFHDHPDDHSETEDAFGQAISRPSCDSCATNLSHHQNTKNPWIKSGYFRSEIQFLVALSNVAERLVALPKSARVSALHAELTLLNHNLPAEICLPLWCSGSCSSYHHRVVRVSPDDAVVLNSAERAPYLLMIEVLEDDLCLENYKDGSLVTHASQTLEHLETPQHLFATEPMAKLHDDTPQSDDDDDEAIDLGMVRSPSTMSITASTSSMSLASAAAPLADTSAKDAHHPSSDFSRQMRTAAVMLAQLQRHDANDPSQVMVHAIRQRVIDQMVSLEEQRLSSVGSLSSLCPSPDNNLLQDEPVLMMNKEDPSAAVFSEDWDVKKNRIRASSPFGHLPNWRLLSVIVKQGADLRQEQFAIQLIREMQKIWEDAGVDAWVKYYRVLVTSEDSGLIETIRNTMSIHSIKKNAYTKHGPGFTLRHFFEQRWGPSHSASFLAAQEAFMKSLVGYSIACYLLQIKDRHNGNLLLDNEGHLIHIDFGFVLSNSPGSVGFEMAPFKLSQEYIDVLGGADSELFARYRMLMKQAFKAVRKYGDNLILLVEMMSKESKLPCFQNGPDYVLLQLKERFQFHLTEPQLEAYVDKLIVNSCGNVFTRLYDTFQYYSQGIL
ncbi:kinase-like protein [Hesseltinella vesiculosa]|uniref:1-phosphatidylinositol 4-kinase n=1 Tax=Hesseltinella vesiculosa TaxID=101127 RepID=A0A1X2GW67_9FUNG|nr:kinase-like protein [Hesseltinella vesiculosa]